jgi:hypothetical protein
MTKLINEFKETFKAEHKPAQKLVAEAPQNAGRGPATKAGGEGAEKQRSQQSEKPELQPAAKGSA